jgi:tetratricopeptide (TPR) repeat protein
MSIYLPPRRRNMVPRWRRADLTATLGELRSSRRHHPPVLTDELEKVLSEWNVNKSPAYASDVVGAALVYGEERQAADAASFLLKTDAQRGLTLRTHVANRILEAPGRGPGEAPIVSAEVLIHESRARAHTYPSSPLAWVDLALAYTNVGQTEKARRYVKVALSLAPQNRYVIRSAVRYYLHTKSADRARHLLQRSPAVVADPWLMSAELAVAGVLNEQPEYIKDARNLLRSSNYSDHDTSELASQLATIQFRDGNRGEARKLFAHALKAPTDNSVAQLRSIADLDSSFDIMFKRASAPRNFEAMALLHFHVGNWSDALNEAWKWYNDEPFARRPAALGSYIASDIIQDYPQGYRFALAGLKSNPDDKA